MVAENGVCGLWCDSIARASSIVISDNMRRRVPAAGPGARPRSRALRPKSTSAGARGESRACESRLARARTRNGPLTDHNGDRGGRRGAVLGAAVERGSHRSAQGEADERRHPGRLHPPTGHLGADEGCDISYPAHVFTEPRSGGWARAPRRGRAACRSALLRVRLRSARYLHS